jgi:hypothetical protein
MIRQEVKKIGNKEFVETISDKGMFIIQKETNRKYSVAYDVMPLRFTYIETNEPIPVEEPIEELIEEVEQ